MTNRDRAIEALLADYAGALRDGGVTEYLRSLTSEEAARIRNTDAFPKAAEVVRVLNGAYFGGRALRPEVGLFISRVNAKIGLRIKRAQAAPRRPRQADVRDTSRTRQ